MTSSWWDSAISRLSRARLDRTRSSDRRRDPDQGGETPPVLGRQGIAGCRKRVVFPVAAIIVERSFSPTRRRKASAPRLPPIAIAIESWRTIRIGKRPDRPTPKTRWTKPTPRPAATRTKLKRLPPCRTSPTEPRKRRNRVRRRWIPGRRIRIVFTSTKPARTPQDRLSGRPRQQSVSDHPWCRPCQSDRTRRYGRFRARQHRCNRYCRSS